MYKILVIDDEAPIRKLLRRLLEKNDYDVMAAKNGNEGLKLFKVHRHDLVITDLLMPDKEGLETIREVKEIKPDVKIIAITGGGTAAPEMYMRLAKQFGAHHAFSKPLENDAFLSTVQEILSG